MQKSNIIYLWYTFLIDPNLF